ncbi:hypothetical protein A2W45_02535 [Candidatus Curtissbacteria bacterium RIFCSPHIGHO2_12_41_11]|uniref:Uncharacterized protein n=3 Tax=Candidatus Curtissiibacteriota TaxID=1752717 RepID=A0A1F5HQX6_9BACT|nr:MAG: hypothetical protein UU56_C0003G0069 [Candidatus Curtissbacteria bacterium GW2011_GWA2_41_24]OGD88434.1 MAG: hypothetical protein A2Z54_02215 [Candidatus Curtissbacteria bacterium RIFCSPHIGHO2_02_39_8]OGD99963.1 MAG: hypothetical protein A2W45_02535 [Candidatus Curtissbacteria bacterium RIFCSPHIGHO2_12_41_11]OGE06601.1 MAG: hypothetical protein A2W70_04025 [Candidatus Curtissbacteria bacterium RIFCSPLOWO2_02_41_11]
MKKKVINKLFKDRVLILSIIVNMLLFAGVGTVYVDSQKTKKLISDQQTKIAELSVSPSPSPVPTTTPLPTPIMYSGPSEKALGIAAGLVVRDPEDDLKNTKKSFGDENMTNAQLINKMALAFDKDPAKMAQGEAMLNQWIAEDSRPNIKVQPAPNTSQSCRSYFIGDTMYTHCY